MLIEKRQLSHGREGKIKLYIAKPENLDEVKAVVFLNHGMGEHIERYEEFAEKLVEDNFIVYGHNHRGHKDSISANETYGYINADDGFQVMVEDSLKIIELIKNEYPSLPLFLFGHSMGSFIVQRVAQLQGKKIKGIVLCGSSKHNKLILNSGIFLSKIISRIKGERHPSKFLNNLTFGEFNKHFKPNRTEYDWLNRNNDEVDKYINDPYCGGVFSSSFYRDFLKGLKLISQNTELIPKTLPILMISGGDDPVGGPKKLIENLYKSYQDNNIKNVNYKLYPGARHELLHEENKEEVIEDCLNWFNNNL